jgi:hypothetical protein
MIRQLCAIYTRKSTEEGLEQSFNSLDAQRESCAAYILSQKHEGWAELNDRYDGGFSGGSMERPGIKALLDDVRSGRISNTALATKAAQHIPIILRRTLLTRRVFNVFEDLLGRPAPGNRCLSHVPLVGGYDEPETLSNQLALFGPIGADAGHATSFLATH